MKVTNCSSSKQAGLICIATIEAKLEAGGACPELMVWEGLRQVLEAQPWPVSRFARAINHWRGALAYYFQSERGAARYELNLLKGELLGQ